MFDIVKNFEDGRVHILLYTPNVEELPVELFEIYSTAEYTGLDGITTNYILVKDSDSDELAFVVKEEEISGGSGGVSSDNAKKIVNLFRKEYITDFTRTINGVERKVKIPNCYNTIDAETSMRYKGEVSYKSTFRIDDTDYEQKKYRVLCQAVTMNSSVKINGIEVTTHKGSFDEFNKDITQYIQYGKNDIEILVKNTYTSKIIPQITDSNMDAGGINRLVYILSTGKVYFDIENFGEDKAHLVQSNVSTTSADLTIKSKLINDSGLVKKVNIVYSIYQSGDLIETVKETVDIPEVGFDINKKFTINNPKLWKGTVEPNLYRVTVQAYIVEEDNKYLCDEVDCRTGFRTISMDNTSFKLNGEDYRLRGIAYHLENKEEGYALSHDSIDKDLELFKELNANATRVHYDGGKYFLDKLDEAGICLYLEIPWNVTFKATDENDPLYINVEEKYHNLIKECFNHPCVITWGISNELTNKSEEANLELAKELSNKLYDYAKTQDDTRLVGYVNFDGNNYSLSNGFKTDYVAFNKYPSWYTHGNTIAQDFAAVKNLVDKDRGDLGFFITEYGAGGCPSQHVVNDETYFNSSFGTGQFSNKGTFHPEEYMSRIHEAWIDFFEKNPKVCGSFAWLMNDFAASVRTEGNNAGINDKGLVTRDRMTKKDAFYLYKASWNKSTPVCYIASRRCYNVDSSVQKLTIKVYSNCDIVELKYGSTTVTKTKSEANNEVVFVFENIPITSDGKVIVEATGKNSGEVVATDKICIHKDFDTLFAKDEFNITMNIDGTRYVSGETGCIDTITNTKKGIIPTNCTLAPNGGITKPSHEGGIIFDNLNLNKQGWTIRFLLKGIERLPGETNRIFDTDTNLVYMFDKFISYVPSLEVDVYKQMIPDKTNSDGNYDFDITITGGKEGIDVYFFGDHSFSIPTPELNYYNMEHFDKIVFGNRMNMDRGKAMTLKRFQVFGKKLTASQIKNLSVRFI